MIHLPALAIGSLQVSALALLLAPPLLLLAFQARPVTAVLALLLALPLLIAAPGPGLVGGVVVVALLSRGLVQPAQRSLCARLALLWLPVAVLQPSANLALWPTLIWTLPTALAASLGVGATLQAGMRWPLALLLALLPFAPLGDALVQPAQVVAELPFAQVAARWQFVGPGEVDATGLAGFWFLADRLARGLLFLTVLLGWVAARRPRPLLRSLAPLLPLAALLLLAGQTALAWRLPAHAPGFPLLTAASHGRNLAAVALAVARVGSLLVLLRADFAPADFRLDACAGVAATLALTLLAVIAPALWGPTWLADPVALALLALALTALVRTRSTSQVVLRAAGLVQAAAAAVLAGGAWAGWATATVFHP